MTFDKVKAALTRKVGFGKFKAPAWVLLAVGGVGIWWWRRRHPGAAPAAPEAAPTDTGGLPADQGYSGLGAGTGGGGGGSPSDLGSTQAPVSWDPGQVAAPADSGFTAAAAPADSGLPADTGFAPVDQGIPDETDTQPGPPRDGGGGGGTDGTGGGPTEGGTPPGTGAPKPPPWRKITLGLPGGKKLTSALPSNATHVRYGKHGELIYQMPNGQWIEQAPGQSRYNIGRGPVKAGVPVPANATNVRLLKSGAVVYDTPSGARIEQAPGHPRYVIRRAPAARQPAEAAHPAAAAQPAAAPPRRRRRAAPPAPPVVKTVRTPDQALTPQQALHRPVTPAKQAAITRSEQPTRRASPQRPTGVRE